MKSRRTVLLGLCVVTLGGIAVASGLHVGFHEPTGDEWEPGNVIVRNTDDAPHSITLRIFERTDSSSHCEGESHPDTSPCYEHVTNQRLRVEPGATTVVEDAYLAPGRYQVEAITGEGARDSTSRVQIWREDGEITGMGTEAVILDGGGVTVNGFVNAGTKDPPPIE